jgi:hypothetical protein
VEYFNDQNCRTYGATVFFLRLGSTTENEYPVVGSTEENEYLLARGALRRTSTLIVTRKGALVAVKICC